MSEAVSLFLAQVLWDGCLGVALPDPDDREDMAPIEDSSAWTTSQRFLGMRMSARRCRSVLEESLDRGNGCFSNLAVRSLDRSDFDIGWMAGVFFTKKSS